ncbi:uncharacterized protein LTR77_005131 [Saxophila tyrrhenica]|uniref:NAD(P)-binding protein n=1 Tax=Saxophila tyrrhenica TaxID=1690608 RepID=A0AAV9PFD9_9PEZI|nr:hypothetical protein LTR77_005131 [Saxophila tyrrhenica]
MDFSSTKRTAKDHGYGFTKTEHNDTYAAIDPTKADLSGKRVLITGSARGLGREIALSFAKAGASGIALLDMLDVAATTKAIPEAALEAGRPSPEVIQLTIDITSIDQVQQAAETIKSTWTTLDILINNAGYLASYQPLGDSDPDKWWRNFEVNVKGVYLMTRSFLPLILASKDKTMIVMSSVGAHHTLPGGSGYETTKLAVLKMNSYLMAEYGSQGLLAYGVAPGGVHTAMGESFPEEFHHLLSDSPRMVADTMVFLTKGRKEWLGGRYVDSRWDMVELMERREEIMERDLLNIGLRV